MATRIQSSTLAALRVQFEARFQDGLSLASPWSSQLAMEVPSSAGENVYGFIESIGQFREWIGEREVQAWREREYRLKNKRFELTYRLNRDKVKDDAGTIAFAANYMQDMGGSAAAFGDRQFASILLNNATCLDGGPFFDPSHTKVDGTTWSNSLALALDATNYETVLAAMQSQTNAAGDVLDVGTDFLLCVSPALRGVAQRIVSAESVTNVNMGSARVLVIPQLATNSNRWFIAAVGKSVKPLIHQVNEAPTFTTYDQDRDDCVKNRNENEYLATFRAGYGVALPHLMFASDPDGAMT